MSLKDYNYLLHIYSKFSHILIPYAKIISSARVFCTLLVSLTSCR